MRLKNWIRRSFRNRMFATILVATLVPLLLCDVVMMQVIVSRAEHTQAQQGGDGDNDDRDDRHIIASLRDGAGLGSLGCASGLRRVHALDVGIAGKLLRAFQMAAGIALVAPPPIAFCQCTVDTFV